MPRDDEGTGRRRVRGRLLLPLVVAASSVVVLSAVVGGRPRIDSPFGSGPALPGQDVPPPLPPSAPPRLPESNGVPPAASTIAQIALVVVAVLVAVVVAVVLIRLLVLAIRNRRRRPRRSGLGLLEAEDASALADAPTVLRGIAAALGALDEDREPGDAVVRAWLGLQQAAEDAGLARSPSETPTEFTGRVLTRTGADRAALRTLLGLYLRARFGGVVITAGEATAARQALRALEASWERVTA